MTMLKTRPAAIDASAHEFISTFVSHVASVLDYGANRIVTLTRVKALLFVALSNEADASEEAWCTLHGMIAELVAAKHKLGSEAADAYLRAFVRENGDLAA
jgi:hypothetical protein